MDFNLGLLISGFGTTVFACLLILLTKSMHGTYSSDSDSGPQKLHTHQVPRIGGVALVVGIIVIAFVANNVVQLDDGLLIASLFALFPVFLFGLAEDITKNIGPRLRLAATLSTGILFVYLFDVTLTKTGLSFSDHLLAFVPVAVFLTVLAISTLINAMNIVDGLNGLSIGSSLCMLIAITLVARDFGDIELMRVTIAIVGCLVGMALFNFPHGRIFMGDSGAYVMGGLVAFAAILVSERNADVSPFFSLLVVSYPFYELIRSIIRRSRGAKTQLMEPDRGHLHSLVFAKMKVKEAGRRHNVNARASCRVLVIPAFCCIWATMFPANSVMLIAGICGMVALYEGGYRTAAVKAES